MQIVRFRRRLKSLENRKSLVQEGPGGLELKSVSLALFSRAWLPKGAAGEPEKAWQVRGATWSSRDEVQVANFLTSRGEEVAGMQGASGEGSKVANTT